MAGEIITSVQNPRVKDAVALRDRRERSRRGQFVIDGVREIGRALAAGVRVVEAFVCEELCRSEESQRVLAILAASGRPPIHVAEHVFAKLAFGDRHDGVLVVAEAPDWSLAALLLPPCPLIAVVEEIEKPGNVGAILRTADGAGISAVIVADPASDLANPNCIRASTGAVFSVPVAAASAGETLAFLRAAGVALFALRVEAERDYTTADFTGPTAIALGSEAHGLSEAWANVGATALRVPMLGGVDSLNVSATAAVLFYEALRQRSRRE